MIKTVLFIAIYCILIPIFYLFFLYLVWLFYYNHEVCPFYDFMNDKEYDNWSEAGKYCRVLSAIFPLGLIIILLYFLFIGIWYLIYTSVIKILEKHKTKSK